MAHIFTTQWHNTLQLGNGFIHDFLEPFLTNSLHGLAGIIYQALAAFFTNGLMNGSNLIGKPPVSFSQVYPYHLGQKFRKKNTYWPVNPLKIQPSSRHHTFPRYVIET
jgi:hypothetical protein